MLRLPAWIESCALKFSQTYCVVDQNLRILWVGGDWDEFALDNGGPSAVSNKVLSSRIDDHIAGKETKDAVVSLIETVLETQNTLTIDYRGDSPYQLRRYQMTVQPMKQYRVLIVHDLREAQNLAHPHPHWHYQPDAPASKCSFCNAVRQGDGDWIPAERLDSHPVAVNYLICENCMANIRAAIEAARANRKPGKPVVNGFGP